MHDSMVTADTLKLRSFIKSVKDIGYLIAYVEPELRLQRYGIRHYENRKIVKSVDQSRISCDGSYGLLMDATYTSDGRG